MDRVRVLVVEDETLLADTIAAGLRRHAMAVDVAYDGDQALRRLDVNDYDVVVLDRDLPKISGDQVCSQLELRLRRKKLHTVATGPDLQLTVARERKISPT